mmetsp:Transcript_7993/g.7488  ORF Transcript_7993/g.7488 Transcript_7993/m.7488 type:complete len:89 (-) Transcript_7993:242-508(-)
MLALLNLKGAYLDDDSFIPLAQTLLHFTQQLEALDLGDNPMLTDQVSGKYLQSIVELAQKLKILKLERIGISNKSLLSIIRALRFTSV